MPIPSAAATSASAQRRATQRLRYVVVLNRRPSSAAFELFMLALVIGAVLAGLVGGTAYFVGHSFRHTKSP